MSFSDFQAGWGRVALAYRRAYEGGKHFKAAANHADQQSGSVLTQRRRNAQSAAAERQRQQLAGYLAQLRGASGPWLNHALDQIGGSSLSINDIRRSIVRYMADNGLYVAPRGVTYGAPPADNVVGIHRRVTVNEFGHTWENGNHHIPNGIKVIVVGTEVSGNAPGRVHVRYETAPADGQDDLTVRSPGVSRGPVRLLGPEFTTLASNAQLFAGQKDNNDPIAAGELAPWIEERVGTPVVRAKTAIRWRSQAYGVGISGDDAEYNLHQPVQSWRLVGSGPMAYMIPAYQDGAGLDCDINVTCGSHAKAFDEGDLTDGAWTPLLPDFDDETLYPAVLDGTDTAFHLKTKLNAGNTGEVIYGGVYAAMCFQIDPNGGEYHIAWARQADPDMHDTVSFGADSQTDEGVLQDAWCRIDERGPALPTAGSSLWVPEGGPVISTPSTLPGGTVSTPYSQTPALSSAGVGAKKWSVVVGTLPDGLSMNPDTGEISGTPTSAETSTFTVRALDEAGTPGYQGFSLTIS